MEVDTTSFHRALARFNQVSGTSYTFDELTEAQQHRVREAAALIERNEHPCRQQGMCEST